jgi:hypothetical protein
MPKAYNQSNHLKTETGATPRAACRFENVPQTTDTSNIIEVKLDIQAITLWSSRFRDRVLL